MMLSAQRLHQPFPDEIDCVKFISICKVTEEKLIFSTNSLIIGIFGLTPILVGSIIAVQSNKINSTVYYADE